MKNFKKNWFIYLVIGLAMVLSFGALAKVNNLITNRKVTQLEYGIGMVSTETGKVGESKQHIYLKELQKVDGAEITLTEDATVTVTCFFYDEDKAFIEASTETDLTQAPEGAVYFRIMITPAEIDGEPATIDIFNMRGYISQVRIVVEK